LAPGKASALGVGGQFLLQLKPVRQPPDQGMVEVHG
jgi:hypothetical protein